MTNKVGRPKKFKSKADIKKKIDAYFKECKEADQPLTITGLALALDTNRETLCRYAKDEEFYDTIKRAKTIVENFAEKRLFSTTPTGAIFALKNFGWKDRPEESGEDERVSPVKIEIEVKDARKDGDA